jgi:membrane protein
MVSIFTTLNACYDVTESRPRWRTRLIAIGLTIALAMFMLVSMFLVIVGPTLAQHLAEQMRVGSAFKWMWWVLQWPVVFALVATAIAIDRLLFRARRRAGLGCGSRPGRSPRRCCGWRCRWA